MSKFVSLKTSARWVEMIDEMRDYGYALIVINPTDFEDMVAPAYKLEDAMARRAFEFIAENSPKLEGEDEHIG